MAKRNIVITGGAGFIGSHVVRLFVNKYPEYNIINLDKLTYAGNLANLKDIESKPNYKFVKGRKEGEDLDLITYVTDRLGHDARYAIDSTKLQKELGWEPSLQFEEGIKKTVRWYLDHQEWMDHITSGEYEKYYEEMYQGR